MKTGRHPTYYRDARVTCACGHTFVTGSTLKTIQVEICSNCHPFYTGTQKLVDTAGRVDRFKRIAERSKAVAGRRKPKAPRRQTPKAKA